MVLVGAGRRESARIRACGPYCIPTRPVRGNFGAPVMFPYSDRASTGFVSEAGAPAIVLNRLIFRGFALFSGRFHRPVFLNMPTWISLENILFSWIFWRINHRPLKIFLLNCVLGVQNTHENTDANPFTDSKLYPLFGMSGAPDRRHGFRSPLPGTRCGETFAGTKV